MSHVSLVTLGVDDVERATAFYERLGWRRSSASVDGVVSFLAGGTVVLALYGRADLAADCGVDARSSYAMNVGSRSAVDDVVSSAAEAGARVTKPAGETGWGGYAGYFADPDGHVWEIAHNPGFPLDDDGRVFLPGFEADMERERADAEQRIDAFIASADDSGGASVQRLAAGVVGELQRARDAVGALLAGSPNDVVLATMLELGRRGRALDSTDRHYWVTSAASTIVSGMIRPGDAPADDEPWQ